MRRNRLGGWSAAWLGCRGQSRSTAVVLAASFAATLLAPAYASAGLPTAGWARGDGPSSPYRQQISSDKNFAAADCAPNDVLLFRVRGSGAGYGVGASKNGQDNLGNWSTALGSALIAKGWSVRDMQAVYSAPGVPLDQIVTNFKNASRVPSAASFANAAVRSAAAAKRFRDVATNEWRQVRKQLIDAAARCPQRKIVIAGYSQGGIMLRYVIPTLPRPLRDQIVRIDILADATADGRVDGAIRHTGPPPARSTSSGIDTYIAKILHGGGQRFVQTTYPTDIATKTIQYCLLHDLVCDANLANFKPQYSAQETTRHTSYPWSAIGTATATPFQTWARAPGPTPRGNLRRGAITAGSTHSCVVVATGQVKCWGHNDIGQLGNASFEDSTAPVAVTGITAATQVSAGSGHSCALLVGGQVQCWGYNLSGALGNGSTQNSSVPVSVTGISNATQVSVGYHSCALLADGSVRCWGSNTHGELGDGSTENSSVPVAVTGVTQAIQVSAGDDHSCALLYSGHVSCWGYNPYGGLGSGGTDSSSVPVGVTGITNATEVSAGSAYSCALLAGGQVKCWGNNHDGELGNGSTENSSTPVVVTQIGPATQITAGYYHACVLLAGGEAKCWGYNPHGDLGSGRFESSSVPVMVTGMTDATEISSGDHSCALLTGSRVKCWGFNAFGELGNGNTENSSVPVTVIGLP